MSNILIFDFNRTLYDPEREQLYPQTREVLTELTALNYRLHLVSTDKPGRERFVADLGLADHFSTVSIVAEKNKEIFARLLGPEVNLKGSGVVGDQVQKEIRLGNQLGLTTYWIRRGKFKDDLPRDELEIPDHSLPDLAALLSLLKSSQSAEGLPEKH